MPAASGDGQPGRLGPVLALLLRRCRALSSLGSGKGGAPSLELPSVPASSPATPGAPLELRAV